MAVYTEIETEALTNFLNLYDLGRLRACKGIAEGVENSNFFLEMENGRFILTLYEKRVCANDLPFFIDLMLHLARAGLACPLPVADKKGQVIQTLCDRPAAMVTFLEGLSLTHPLESHCFKTGEALADLHLKARGFSGTRPNPLSIKGWHHLWDHIKHKANDFMPGLEAEVNQDLDILSRLWPEDLPSGTIHADLFPDNVFFLNDDFSGIIDFYFACTDFLAYDLAICINAWCFNDDGTYHANKGTALIAGYQSHRSLSPRELNALPILSHGAALRFFLTRLTDWYNTPKNALVRPKNPLDYLERLRYHRLQAAA